jgi:hypothetical protein
VRFLVFLVAATVLLFFVFWVGSQIAWRVSWNPGEDEAFLRGSTLDLCGYEVDSRLSLAGYDLEEWSGERCESLSELDICLLECLSRAGTVEIASSCYESCVREQGAVLPRRP